MKVLELFAGSRSIGKICNERGHETFSTDLYDFEGIDYQNDILKFDFEEVPFVPDMIWASPPCTSFSVASIGHHWTGGAGKYKPKTNACRLGLKILRKTIEIIAHYQKINPNITFYIENPTGVMRKVIDEIFEEYGIVRKRSHVWYCKYGFDIAKPTDIWTNNSDFIGKKCHNKRKDSNGVVIEHCHHQSAPRGSRTGVQGLKGDFVRSMIPPKLCEHIINITEKRYES